MEVGQGPNWGCSAKEKIMRHLASRLVHQSDAYLYGALFSLKSDHPSNERVVRSFVDRTKVKYQDRKDFSRETEKIKHDVILNEYPQNFIDSIMKPERSNHPSDRLNHGTVIIPHVRGISEKKIRYIEDHFNIRTILKIDHTLRGVLNKTGPVRYAQQTKQGVRSTPCDCGRCYIG
jgi:hypothetical protein